MDLKTWASSLSEAKIAAKLLEMHYEVFTGTNGKTSCDLIAINNCPPIRIQVKSCVGKNASGNWQVELKSVRSNKTSNQIYNFDANKCDILAVYILVEDKILFFDANNYQNKTCLTIKTNGEIGHWQAPLS